MLSLAAMGLATTLPPAALAEDAPPAIDEPVEIASYTVAVKDAPSDAVAADLEKALALYRYQENGAPSLALLRRRAQDDRTVVQKVLRSHGYYEGDARVDVAAGEDGKSAAVTVTVQPGRPYVLSEHTFLLTPTPLAQAMPKKADSHFGSPVGQPAEAAGILAAEEQVVGALKTVGYPYARLIKRDAEIDPEAATMQVTSRIDTGPLVTYGDLSIQGATGIDDAYLRTYLPWKKGEPVNTVKLTEYQRSLIGTGLFNAGSVLLPETAPPPGAAPVTARLEPRPFRSIAVGVNYSTDLGPGAKAEFDHRNLFGANETLRLTTDVTASEQHLDGQLRKPQFRRNKQDLVGQVSLRHIEDDAFDETGITLTLGLERQLSRFWRAGLGGLAEVTDTTSSDAEGRAYLVGMPAFAQYDNSDDLLNPSKGIRLHVATTPFMGRFDSRFTPFLLTELNGASYFDLTGKKRYIAAVRTRLGSILSGDLSDVPAGRRLYAGGGGSLRGYAERKIGPLDSHDDPTGGRSVVEAVAELRAQVYGDFGLAVFAGAASVSEDVVPTFSSGMQFSAGLGFRYYSPLGPIRADVAVPLNPRSVDDSFQIYFSIGQAF